MKGYQPAAIWCEVVDERAIGLDGAWKAVPQVGGELNVTGHGFAVRDVPETCLRRQPIAMTMSMYSEKMPPWQNAFPSL